MVILRLLRWLTWEQAANLSKDASASFNKFQQDFPELLGEIRSAFVAEILKQKIPRSSDFDRAREVGIEGWRREHVLCGARSLSQHQGWILRPDSSARETEN